MHEVAIVEGMMEAARREWEGAGATGRVTRLGVVVGRLSCASPDAMRFAFEAMSPGTIMEGAALDIEEVMAMRRCRECGAAGETTEIFEACPACGSVDVLVEGGRDLVLRTIEIEGEGEAAKNVK